MPAARGRGQDEIMHPVLIVIGIGWLAFWVYWLVASLSAKASRGRWGRFVGARVILIVVAVYLIRSRWGGSGGLRAGRNASLADPLLEGIGLALWAAGLGLAIWARLYIGRNWGMPMTRRQEPDLVTTGPYRFIRHPIYTGILLALIGTAIATTLFGLIVVAILAVYFIFSATREEKFLAGEFPDAYPDYKARTKMLVPFVF
jgi:protein-S-isoprenylcysteine O-methyltransferase Ste14